MAAHHAPAGDAEEPQLVLDGDNKVVDQVAEAVLGKELDHRELACRQPCSRVTGTAKGVTSVGGGDKCSDSPAVLPPMPGPCTTQLEGSVTAGRTIRSYGTPAFWPHPEVIRAMPRHDSPYVLLRWAHMF